MKCFLEKEETRELTRKLVNIQRREKQDDGNGTRAKYGEAPRKADGLHGGLPTDI